MSTVSLRSCSSLETDHSLESLKPRRRTSSETTIRWIKSSITKYNIAITSEVEEVGERSVVEECWVGVPDG